MKVVEESRIMRPDIWLIYVAGPYNASTIEEIIANVDAAQAVASTITRCGEGKLLAIAPHTIGWANTNWGGGATWGDDIWLKLMMELMRRCDGVVCLPGESAGTRSEAMEAISLNKPIVFISEDVKNVNWEEIAQMLIKQCEDNDGYAIT